MGIPLILEPRYAIQYWQIVNLGRGLRPVTSTQAVLPKCSAASGSFQGLAENDTNCGHFDRKCHFMWLNHANNCAQYFYKLLIYMTFVQWLNDTFVARRQQLRFFKRFSSQ